MNTNPQNALDDMLSSIEKSDKEIKEAETALRNAKNIKVKQEVAFFQELTKDCSKPNPDSDSGAESESIRGKQFIPIGINNFICYPKLEKNYITKGYVITGTRYEFISGNLVGSGRTVEMPIEEWLNLSDDVKKQDFKMLQDANQTLKFLPNGILGYFRDANIITENENFYLVICKERRPGAKTIPRQLLIYPKIESEENIKALEKALELTAMQPHKVFGTTKEINGSQVLEEDCKVSNKILRSHESFLNHIFGEGVVDKALKIIENTKNMKSKGVKGRISAPSISHSSRSIDDIKL